MRTASGVTTNILAGGQWNYCEMYDIKLKSNSTVIRLSGIDSDMVFAGVTYSRGFAIVRGSVSQVVGLTTQEVEITIAPIADAVSQPTIGGNTLQQLADEGLLDNAEITIWEAFLSSYADTSPGLVHLFKGRVGTVKAGRLKTVITVTSGIALLDIDMPRNILQSTCTHALFDPGCTLLRSAFLVSGASVTGAPGVLSMQTSLTQPDGYFNLGQLDFVTGPNAGFSRTVRSYSHTTGLVKFFQPLPFAPSVGHVFNVSPGCNKTQAQCSNSNALTGPAFNNLIHYGGKPYIPVVETLYDGGTVSPPTPGSGRQGAVITGSNPSSNKTDPGTYVP